MANIPTFQPSKALIPPSTGIASFAENINKVSETYRRIKLEDEEIARREAYRQQQAEMQKEQLQIQKQRADTSQKYMQQQSEHMEASAKIQALTFGRTLAASGDIEKAVEYGLTREVAEKIYNQAEHDQEYKRVMQEKNLHLTDLRIAGENAKALQFNDAKTRQELIKVFSGIMDASRADIQQILMDAKMPKSSDAEKAIIIKAIIGSHPSVAFQNYNRYVRAGKISPELALKLEPHMTALHSAISQTKEARNAFGLPDFEVEEPIMMHELFMDKAKAGPSTTGVKAVEDVIGDSLKPHQKKSTFIMALRRSDPEFNSLIQHAAKKSIKEGYTPLDKITPGIKVYSNSPQGRNDFIENYILSKAGLIGFDDPTFVTPEMMSQVFEDNFLVIIQNKLDKMLAAPDRLKYSLKKVMVSPKEKFAEKAKTIIDKAVDQYKGR